MHGLFYASGLLLLAGCAIEPSAAALKVADADQQTVAGCIFLGDVTGTSTVGGLFRATGAGNAKVDGRNNAADMGANRVIWGMMDSGFGGAAISGKAYRCP